MIRNNKQEYNKVYYIKNRDKLLTRSNKYHLDPKNKDKIKANAKKYKAISAPANMDKYATIKSISAEVLDNLKHHLEETKEEIEKPLIKPNIEKLEKLGSSEYTFEYQLNPHKKMIIFI